MTHWRVSRPSVETRLRLLLPLAALLGGAAPAVEREAQLPESLVFSVIDGSSADADGVADGVWTSAGALALEQTLTCGDEAASGECSVTLAVAGDLELASGAGIRSSGTLRLVVEGALRLARGSFLASEQGGVDISATGGITIDGLVAATAGSGRGSSDRAGILIESTGGPGNGIRLGATATLISEGSALGGNVIELAGCGIEVMGLVAAVASGPDTAVVMRSCEDLRIDGRDLGRGAGVPGGKRLGRVEVHGRGGSPHIALSARDSVVLDGTELGVGQGPESRIAVTAELGSLSWRRGRGRVDRSEESGEAERVESATHSGEPVGRIRLSACGGVDLTGAELHPRTELEVVEACGRDEEVDDDEGSVSPQDAASLTAIASGEAQTQQASSCTPNLVLSNQTVSIIREFLGLRQCLGR